MDHMAGHAFTYGVGGNMEWMVAHSNDAAKEIVTDNRTGLLVEQNPNDIAAACVRLLTDDPLALRLGEAGRRQYLKNFRFHHFRKRFLKAVGLS